KTNNSKCKLMASKLLKSTTIYGSLYEGKYGSKYARDKGILSSGELINRIKEILKEKINVFPELINIINFEWKESNKLAVELGKKAFFSPNFVNINYDHVEKALEEGRICLFEITNHDLAINNKNCNIHTEYFKNLFSEDNLSK